MPKESYEKLVAYEDNPYVLFIPCSTDATDYWGVYCVPRERVDEVDSILRDSISSVSRFPRQSVPLSR